MVNKQKTSPVCSDALEHFGLLWLNFHMGEYDWPHGEKKYKLTVTLTSDMTW